MHTQICDCYIIIPQLLGIFTICQNFLTLGVLPMLSYFKKLVINSRTLQKVFRKKKLCPGICARYTGICNIEETITYAQRSVPPVLCASYFNFPISVIMQRIFSVKEGRWVRNVHHQTARTQSRLQGEFRSDSPAKSSFHNLVQVSVWAEEMRHCKKRRERIIDFVGC